MLGTEMKNIPSRTPRTHLYIVADGLLLNDSPQLEWFVIVDGFFYFVLEFLGEGIILREVAGREQDRLIKFIKFVELLGYVILFGGVGQVHIF